MKSKYRQLCALLEKIEKVAVAYSGGVDSTLLLKAALDSHGPDKVVAAFGRSVLQKTESIDGALSRAREFKCKIIVVDILPLSWPDFTVNSSKRCYWCKREIYKALTEAVPSGYQIVDGTNIDDLSQHRPGLRALQELSIRTPLAEVSLTKKEIRSLSRMFDLPTWDLPSESCLATRIPTGTVISENELEILNGYLPKQLTEEELKEKISNIINDNGFSGGKDMGKVMGLLKESFDGQYDGKMASQLVKTLLN